MTTKQLQKQTYTDELPVGEVEVKPHETMRISLGIFPPTSAPLGFSIHMSPNVTTADNIDAEIESSENQNKREFALCIANRGNKSICAEVCELRSHPA